MVKRNFWTLDFKITMISYTSDRRVNLWFQNSFLLWMEDHCNINCLLHLYTNWNFVIVTYTKIIRIKTILIWNLFHWKIKISTLCIKIRSFIYSMFKTKYHISYLFYLFRKSLRSEQDFWDIFSIFYLFSLRCKLHPIRQEKASISIKMRKIR